ncbi:MAG: amylo-alpha-1,6-glucosidase [Candidatus Omnitrophica bacterium]|nr:amylo-alpha-1,6-glucosidase [Candidatus Omnitrophota bacterium]
MFIYKHNIISKSIIFALAFSFLSDSVVSANPDLLAPQAGNPSVYRQIRTMMENNFDENKHIAKFVEDRSDKARKLSYISGLEDDFRQCVKASDAEGMFIRLKSTLIADGGKIQLIILDKGETPPKKLGGESVWGYADKDITVFVSDDEWEILKNDQTAAKETKRKIIARLFHEIRARSTKAKELFEKGYGRDKPDASAEVPQFVRSLREKYEKNNREMEKEIKKHGRIKSKALREEFAGLTFFDGRPQLMNRDYTMAETIGIDDLVDLCRKADDPVSWIKAFKNLSAVDINSKADRNKAIRVCEEFLNSRRTTAWHVYVNEYSGWGSACMSAEFYISRFFERINHNSQCPGVYRCKDSSMFTLQSPVCPGVENRFIKSRPRNDTTLLEFRNGRLAMVDNVPVDTYLEHVWPSSDTEVLSGIKEQRIILEKEYFIDCDKPIYLGAINYGRYKSSKTTYAVLLNDLYVRYEGGKPRFDSSGGGRSYNLKGMLFVLYGRYSLDKRFPAFKLARPSVVIESLSEKYLKGDRDSLKLQKLFANRETASLCAGTPSKKPVRKPGDPYYMAHPDSIPPEDPDQGPDLNYQPLRAPKPQEAGQAKPSADEDFIIFNKVRMHLTEAKKELESIYPTKSFLFNARVNNGVVEIGVVPKGSPRNHLSINYPGFEDEGVYRGAVWGDGGLFEMLPYFDDTEYLEEDRTDDIVKLTRILNAQIDDHILISKAMIGLGLSERTSVLNEWMKVKLVEWNRITGRPKLDTVKDIGTLSRLRLSNQSEPQAVEPPKQQGAERRLPAEPENLTPEPTGDLSGSGRALTLLKAIETIEPGAAGVFGYAAALTMSVITMALVTDLDPVMYFMLGSIVTLSTAKIMTKIAVSYIRAQMCDVLPAGSIVGIAKRSGMRSISSEEEYALTRLAKTLPPNFEFRIFRNLTYWRWFTQGEWPYAPAGIAEMIGKRHVVSLIDFTATPDRIAHELIHVLQRSQEERDAAVPLVVPLERLLGELGGEEAAGLSAEVRRVREDFLEYWKRFNGTDQTNVSIALDLEFGASLYQRIFAAAFEGDARVIDWEDFDLENNGRWDPVLGRYFLELKAHNPKYSDYVNSVKRFIAAIEKTEDQKVKRAILDFLRNYYMSLHIAIPLPGILQLQSPALNDQPGRAPKPQDAGQTPDPAAVKKRFEELRVKYGSKAAWLMILQELGLPEKLGFKIPNFAVPDSGLIMRIIEKTQRALREFDDIERSYERSDLKYRNTKLHFEKFIEEFIEGKYDEEGFASIISANYKGFLKYASIEEWKELFRHLKKSYYLKLFENAKYGGSLVPPSVLLEIAKQTVTSAMIDKISMYYLDDAEKREFFKMASELGEHRIWRSSAFNEDTFLSSMAGKYLSLRTEESAPLGPVCDFGPDLRDNEIRPLYQDYIFAEKSGIAFSDLAGITTIEAVLGECASAVIGENNTIIDIDRETGVINDINYGFYPSPSEFSIEGGSHAIYMAMKTSDIAARMWSEKTVDVVTARGGRKKSPLSKEEIERVRDVIRGLQKALGFPVDIEFSFEGNDFDVQQVRPITGDDDKRSFALPDADLPSAINSSPISIGYTANEGFEGNIVEVYSTPELKDYSKRLTGKLSEKLKELGYAPDNTIIAIDQPLLLASGYNVFINTHSASRIYHTGINFRETDKIIGGMPGFDLFTAPKIAWDEKEITLQDWEGKEYKVRVRVSRDKVRYYSNGFRGLLVRAVEPPKPPLGGGRDIVGLEEFVLGNTAETVVGYLMAHSTAQDEDVRRILARSDPVKAAEFDRLMLREAEQNVTDEKLQRDDFLGSDKMPALKHIKIRKWVPARQIFETGQKYAEGKDSNGIAPIGGVPTHYLEELIPHIVDEVDKKGCAVSFKSDLEGAEILYIGLGFDVTPMMRFIRKYPKIKAIHLLDVNSKTFGVLDMLINENRSELPSGLKIYGYRATVLDMPQELTGAIDIVTDRKVFDTWDDRSFSLPQIDRALEEIYRVLKPGGIHSSFGKFAITEYPETIDMEALGKLDARGEESCVFVKPPAVNPGEFKRNELTAGVRGAPSLAILAAGLASGIMLMAVFFVNDVIYGLLRNERFYQSLLNKHPKLCRFLKGFFNYRILPDLCSSWAVRLILSGHAENSPQKASSAETSLVPGDIDTLITALQGGADELEFYRPAVARFLNIILSPHLINVPASPHSVSEGDYESAKKLHAFLGLCGPVVYSKFIKIVNQMGFQEKELFLDRPLISGVFNYGHTVVPDPLMAHQALYPGLSRESRREPLESLAGPWLMLAGADESQLKAIFDGWLHGDGTVVNEAWFGGLIERAKDNIRRALPEGKSLSPVVNFFSKRSRLDPMVPTESRIMFGYMAIGELEKLRGQVPRKALTHEGGKVRRLPPETKPAKEGKDYGDDIPEDWLAGDAIKYRPLPDDPDQTGWGGIGEPGLIEYLKDGTIPPERVARLALQDIKEHFIDADGFVSRLDDMANEAKKGGNRDLAGACREVIDIIRAGRSSEGLSPGSDGNGDAGRISKFFKWAKRLFSAAASSISKNLSMRKNGAANTVSVLRSHRCIYYNINIKTAAKILLDDDTNGILNFRAKGAYSKISFYMDRNAALAQCKGNGEEFVLEFDLWECLDARIKFTGSTQPETHHKVPLEFLTYNCKKDLVAKMCAVPELKKAILAKQQIVAERLDYTSWEHLAEEMGIAGDGDLWENAWNMPIITFRAVLGAGEDFAASAFDGHTYFMPREFVAGDLEGDDQRTPSLRNPYRLPDELINELKYRAFLKYTEKDIAADEITRRCREIFPGNYIPDPYGNIVSRVDTEIETLRLKCKSAARFVEKPVRIYEVNVAVRINELKKSRGGANLADPDFLTDEKLEELKALGYTHVWLMGEKERDAAAAEIAAWFGKEGPSPYALKSNNIDEEWGGEAARNILAARLKKFGLELAGDHVTNHFGFVGDIMRRYPQLFVIRDKNPALISDYWFDYDEWKNRHPEVRPIPALQGKVVLRAQERRWGGGTKTLGTGDVAQISIHSPDAIDIITSLVDEAASKVCGPDGQGAGLLRFDLAHCLWRNDLLDRVGGFLSYEEWMRFNNNYRGIEPWKVILNRIRKKYPNLIAVAEVYGGAQSNADLLALGFDFAYDKERGFYDMAVLRKDALSLNVHMRQLELMRRAGLYSVLLDETHDEHSIAGICPRAQHAAILFLRRLSGHAELMFSGEESGMDWGKHNAEDKWPRDFKGDLSRRAMYEHPLLKHPALMHGRRKPLAALNGNGQEGAIAAYILEHEGKRYLGMANISNSVAKGRVNLDPDSIFDNKSTFFRFRDIVGDYNKWAAQSGYAPAHTEETAHVHRRQELKSLYVELEPNNVQLFEIAPSENARPTGKVVPDGDVAVKGFADFYPKLTNDNTQPLKENRVVYVTVDFTDRVAGKDVRLIMHCAGADGRSHSSVEGRYADDFKESHRFKFVVPEGTGEYTLETSFDRGATWYPMGWNIKIAGAQPIGGGRDIVSLEDFARDHTAAQIVGYLKAHGVDQADDIRQILASSDPEKAKEFDKLLGLAGSQAGMVQIAPAGAKFYKMPEDRLPKPAVLQPSAQKTQTDEEAAVISDAIINKGEMYPMGGEAMSAIEGDDIYIVTRVPDEFLNKEGLEVWICSDLNGGWENTVRMEKVIKENPGEDRFVGKIRLNRAGTVQYKCRWLIRENGRISSQGWATPPSKNCCILVRQKNDSREEGVSTEERSVMLRAFRRALAGERMDPRYFERRINYKFIKDALENRRGLSTKNLPEDFEEAVYNIFLSRVISNNAEWDIVDRSYQPSQAQNEAVQEAGALLTEFYGFKIDLLPLVLWGDPKRQTNNGEALTIHDFIIINSKEHVKAQLRHHLVHEFLHQFEGRPKLYCPSLEESVVDYLTMVICKDYNLGNYYYREGMKLVGILVDLVGFEKVYRFFRDTDFKGMEESLGDSGERVLRILMSYYFATDADIFPEPIKDAQEDPESAKISFREFLANRNNTAYLDSFEQETEVKREGDLVLEAGIRNMRSRALGIGVQPMDVLGQLLNNIFERSAIKSDRERIEKNPPLSLPDLEAQVNRIREEWLNTHSMPAASGVAEEVNFSYNFSPELFRRMDALARPVKLIDEAVDESATPNSIDIEDFDSLDREIKAQADGVSIEKMAMEILGNAKGGICRAKGALEPGNIRWKMEEFRLSDQTVLKITITQSACKNDDWVYLKENAAVADKEGIGFLTDTGNARQLSKHFFEKGNGLSYFASVAKRHGGWLRFRRGAEGDNPMTTELFLRIRERVPEKLRLPVLNALKNEPAGSVWEFTAQISEVFKEAASLFVKYPFGGRPPEIWAANEDWFFEPWGRDEFISLPGLLITTGKLEDAKKIFRLFGSFQKDGLIPNRIFDTSKKESAMYNTSDASLWFIQALKKYAVSTGDWDFAVEMLPAVQAVISGYENGTGYMHYNRFNSIKMDPSDGLVVTPAQSTWMDADPYGADHPVTPRNGKAVEINALWYSNLRFFAGLLEKSGKDKAMSEHYAKLADKVKVSFNDKFWNDKPKSSGISDEKEGALFDVIEGDPHGGAIRPNMIFAVSNGDDILSPERQRSVLKAVTADLLTPYGLRTLSPRDSHYKGYYFTDLPMHEKDQAYHQGPAWPWLIGAYVDALCTVMKNEGASNDEIEAKTREILEPLTLFMFKFGSLPELFDGNLPQCPGGTHSQAWSVAEVFRALVEHGGISIKPESSADGVENGPRTQPDDGFTAPPGEARVFTRQITVKPGRVIHANPGWVLNRLKYEIDRKAGGKVAMSLNATGDIKYTADFDHFTQFTSFPEVEEVSPYILVSISSVSEDLANRVLELFDRLLKDTDVLEQRKPATPDDYVLDDYINEIRAWPAENAAALAADEALEEILKIIPGALNFTDFMAELALILQIADIFRQDNSTFIFSEKIAFDNRLAAFLPKLIDQKKGAKVGVLLSSEDNQKAEREKALIDILNKGKPRAEWIECATTIAELRANTPSARYYYFRMRGDPEDPGLAGVSTMPELTPDMVKRIIDSICKACRVELEKLPLLHELARIFAEAA